MHLRRNAQAQPGESGGRSPARGIADNRDRMHGLGRHARNGFYRAPTPANAPSGRQTGWDSHGTAL